MRGASLLLSALAALPLQKSKSDAKAFAGEWMTSVGPMELTAKGSTITGHYGWSKDAKIEGKLEEKRLVFEWNNKKGGGDAWFELWEDGKTFVGESTFPGGKEFWGGYRLAPEKAAIEPGQVTEGQTKSGLNYHLRVPKDYDAKKHTTGVVLFHGSNASARDYVQGFPVNWPELAERFVLVGFDGERLSSGSRVGRRAFNASYVEFSGDHIGEPWRYNQTPFLVAQALEQLEEELAIERWFVGGHSQGGFLTLAVMMFYPEHVAGAFEVSGNLLVQCEPTYSYFAEHEKIRAAQRRVPLAIVHGEKDDVVQFSAATYTHDQFQDAGFPMVRLFAAPMAGHPWLSLPVDDALRWLEEMASADPAALVQSAETALDEQRWRDGTALLQKARGLTKDPELGAWMDALAAKADAAAAPEAEALAQRIASDKKGDWVDAFWEFRERFGLAPAAKGVLAAYQELRDDHQEPADERFRRARSLRDAEKKKELYREIVGEYFASSYYRLVKSWL